MKRKAATPLLQTTRTQKPRYLNQTQSLVNPRVQKSLTEKKNLDVSATLTQTGVSSWTQVLPINIITVGTGPNNRIGRKVQQTKFLLRWASNTGALAIDISPWRFLVVFDKQTNAALPVVTDILQINSIRSPNNLSNSDRFITICDFITETPSTSNQSLTGIQTRKINLEVMFNTTNGGTIADIQSGAFYILACNADATATHPIDVYTRIRYTDA